MKSTRIEKDSLGQIEVAEDALYAAQTQRAINNFKVSSRPMPEEFIRALLTIKACAAKANAKLDQLPDEMAKAIVEAVKSICNESKFATHFPVDVFQTGSGTSTNMNANEVLACLATKVYQQTNPNDSISPNDHVNCGQSSNDVIPTTIHVSAALELNRRLVPELLNLRDVTLKKAESVGHFVKTGRTHLMDAMPVRFGQTLEAWAGQIDLAINRIEALKPQLQSLALGGTAVGTGVNAHPEFALLFNKILSEETSLEFKPADNFFTHIGSQDIAVALSGELNACAVIIMKIANDLRWMNSGPLAGLGEIALEALQPGSSIMPGKVNPVIPESAAMVAAQVMGNNTTISVAGQSGNFELNVMLPVIADNLLNSIKLLSNTCGLLAEKAIASFEVNESKITEALSRNPILITALNPIIGYEKAAEIAKQAYQEGRAVIDVANEKTELSYQELSELLDPTKLTYGGI